MFEAEFSGKLPEISNREDYLTSCIFGALKYLAPSDVFYPFISRAYNYFSKQTLTEHLATLGIELSDFTSMKTLFWPYSSTFGEPDLMFILEGAVRRVVIGMEVKFFSGKHGKGENDQLVRYFQALSVQENRHYFSVDDIKNCSDELVAFIYLTQFEAEREIEQSLQILRAQGINAQDKFFHLKWQQLLGVVNSIAISQERSYKKAICEDIIRLLRLKNLVPFTGFSHLPDELSINLLGQAPVFLKLVDGQSNSFKGFPMLSLNLSQIHRSGEYLFYKGASINKSK